MLQKVGSGNVCGKVNRIREKLYSLFEEYVRYSPFVTSTSVGAVRSTRGNEDNIGEGDEFDESKRVVI